VIQVLTRLVLTHVVRNPPAPLRIAVLLAAVVAYGATGFLYFELPANPDLSWTDGFWYSLVTISTVGYGDYFPKTTGGRLLVAVPLMFFGIGLLGYVLSIAASALVEAKSKELKGMSEFKLEDHLVIINFPGVAKVERVLAELVADALFRGRQVVLIDDELEELPPELARRGVRFVRGNPTRDETLTRASLDTAKFAIVLSKRAGDPRSDDQNVAITLAIEARQQGVHTVVECVDYSAQELLRKAGCDGIVCTSRFDAHFLSHELLNPGVQEVVEELTSNLEGEQIYITPFDGKSATTFDKISERCREAGHLAIGIRRDGSARLNVSGDTKVEPGDSIVTIGAERLGSI